MIKHLVAGFKGFHAYLLYRYIIEVDGQLAALVKTVAFGMALLHDLGIASSGEPIRQTKTDPDG